MTTEKENKIIRKGGYRKAKYSWLNVKFGLRGATLLALALIAFMLVQGMVQGSYRWDYTKSVILPENEGTGIGTEVTYVEEVVNEELSEKSTGPAAETLDLEYPAIPQFPDKVLELNDLQPLDDSVVPKTIKSGLPTRGSGYTSGVLHQ
jgi:hypothetical protein